VNRNGNPTGTLEERFWAKVDKGGPVQSHMVIPDVDERLYCCWEWVAARAGSLGYGWVWLGKDKGYTLAHRASWIINRRGSIEGIQVLHICDYPLCVRPSHLFRGTQLDNMRDRSAKGRGNFDLGEDCHNAKMTVDKVRLLRKMRKAGFTYSQLSVRFEIAEGQCHGIVNRKYWKHVA
jgi:hypothetical protein